MKKCIEYLVIVAVLVATFIYGIVVADYVQAAYHLNDNISITVITSSNCKWCDKFKELTLDNPNVQKALLKYKVRVSFVDIYDPSIREVVRGVPHVVFYKNGKKICYFVGYKDKDEFLKYLVETVNA